MAVPFNLMNHHHFLARLKANRLTGTNSDNRKAKIVSLSRRLAAVALVATLAAGSLTGCAVFTKTRIADGDGDGVPDDIDRCVVSPAGCVVDEYGCEVDGDNDGVCDGIDQCLYSPVGCIVDAVGCQLDGDRDGVCDGIDKCPNTPEIAEIDPFGCSLDSDSDLVPDYRDNCPGTPPGCVVDDSGCPRDSDGDGVCDGVDQCPTTPKDLEVDAKGCPVAYEIPEITVLMGVNFETNGATLTEAARVELDKVVEKLRALPHVRLEVQGHTDIKGSRERNIELSQRHAQAVVDYFVAQGIEPARLIAKGFGPDKPMYDNDNREGRKNNGRIELVRMN